MVTAVHGGRVWFGDREPLRVGFLPWWRVVDPPRGKAAMGRGSERDPEDCEHEAGRFEGKTICDVKGREVYTNCREVGHCVLGGEAGACDEEEEWE